MKYDRGSMSVDEVVKFRTRPNPLLYSLEATRIYFAILMFVSILAIPLLYLAKGVSITFLVELLFLTNCALFVIFFVAVALKALGIAFVVTNKRVIVQAPLGSRVSIPFKDIKSVEVRCYGPRYGSVYFELYNDPHEEDRKSVV